MSSSFLELNVLGVFFFITFLLVFIDLFLIWVTFHSLVIYLDFQKLFHISYMFTFIQRYLNYFQNGWLSLMKVYH